MIVTRGDHTFEVDDNDLSGDWGFWERFANGSWEPEILDRIPELIDGGTFLDIGSWIGPHLLVASRCADMCVGYEPDPTAFAVLERNVGRISNVHIVNAAVSDRTGLTTITTAGDSMSRTGTGDHEVWCTSIPDLLDTVTGVTLVKIDIEGAEQDVFPHGSTALRSLDCPVFLSIHPWVTRDPLADTTGWDIEAISDSEVLLWPA